MIDIVSKLDYTQCFVCGMQLEAHPGCQPVERHAKGGHIQCSQVERHAAIHECMFGQVEWTLCCA